MPKSKLLWLIASGVLGGGAAPVVDPEITVTGNGVEIADGDNTPSALDHTNFGLTVSLTTVSRTFNIAVAAANLTGVSVALSGSGAAGFTITDQPDATINASANSDFTIRYDALTPIAYTATVTISSNELDDFTFDILGSSLYSARVLALSPFDYRTQREGSGPSLTDSSTNAHAPGTFTGITWDAAQSPPMLGTVPNYDGANDYGTATIPGINLDEFTVIIWFKMSGAGVWTDATIRYFFTLQRDANNLLRIWKDTTNNQIRWRRVGSSTTKSGVAGSQSDTGWVSYTFSCSIAGNALLGAGEAKLWKNGVTELGSTLTANVASAGSGDCTLTLGALNSTPTSVHSGPQADWVFFNTAATASLLDLGRV